MLAGAARQQPSCHCGCNGGTGPSASTCIVPALDIMTATDAERRQHSRRHRAGRSRGRSHTRRTSAAGILLVCAACQVVEVFAEEVQDKLPPSASDSDGAPLQKSKEKRRKCDDVCKVFVLRRLSCLGLFVDGLQQKGRNEEQLKLNEQHRRG